MLHTHENELDTFMLSLVFMQSLKTINCSRIFMFRTLHMVHEDLGPYNRQTALHLLGWKQTFILTELSSTKSTMDLGLTSTGVGTGMGLDVPATVGASN